MCCLLDEGSGRARDRGGYELMDHPIKRNIALILVGEPFNLYVMDRIDGQWS
jgi:hypothetical protein